ncbi:hypothetical protein EJ110_NYTH52722 [Nymphaea thermarum]|nr:hypothetical protein EJ110_NYTH52722 [Nymphaea thermarum]
MVISVKGEQKKKSFTNSRFICYMPSIVASSIMLYVINQLGSFNAMEYENQLLGVMEISKGVAEFSIERDSTKRPLGQDRCLIIFISLFLAASLSLFDVEEEEGEKVRLLEKSRRMRSIGVFRRDLAVRVFRTVASGSVHTTASRSMHTTTPGSTLSPRDPRRRPLSFLLAATVCSWQPF